MSGDDWTLHTTRVALTQLIVEHDRRYQERFAAQEHAVELALAGTKAEFTEHVAQAREESRLALAAVERARTIEREGSTRALDLASAQMESRLDKLNQFRGALADAQLTLMPRSESAALHSAIDARVTAMAERVDERADANARRIAELALEARGYVTRLEIDQLRSALSEAIPRQEAKLQIDALGSRLDGMQRSTAELSNVVIGLRASLAGAGAGADEVNASGERTRNTILVIAAVVAIGVSLFVGLRHNPTTVTTNNNPTTVTTNNNPTTPAVTVAK